MFSLKTDNWGNYRTAGIHYLNSACLIICLISLSKKMMCFYPCYAHKKGFFIPYVVCSILTVYNTHKREILIELLAVKHHYEAQCMPNLHFHLLYTIAAQLDKEYILQLLPPHWIDKSIRVSNLEKTRFHHLVTVPPPDPVFEITFLLLYL